jgi:hypothetical protein
LLSKYIKQDYSKKTSSSFKQVFKTPIAWYCALFQKKKYSKASPHKIVIRGVEREVNNLCATCYRMDKIKSQNQVSTKSLNKSNNKITEQSSKGKGKTHMSTNRQNQSTTEKLGKLQWP